MDNSKFDRVAILGARGWFGRTALAMLMPHSRHLLLTGSVDSQLKFNNQTLSVRQQSLQLVQSFAPTLVIDCAFLTRDKLSSMDFESYVRENKKLIMDAGSVALLPSVEKFVGFSSGAAVHLAGQKDFSLENNPYGALKKEYEETLDTASKEARADISIARVWSVSGSQVTKPDLFALSNLIMQAKSGHIEVRAPRKVFRRYAAIEDVIDVALGNKGLSGSQIFDTGGELIEISELANLVKALVNPEAKIQRAQQVEGAVDDYHSDGESWKKLVSDIGIEAADLNTQILRVAQNF